MAFRCGVDNITDDSAVFWAEFTGGDASYSNYRYCLLQLSDSYETVEYEIRSDERGGADSYFEERLRNLIPDMHYQCDAQLGYVNNGRIEYLDVYAYDDFWTDPAPIEIDPWSWTRSNGSASSSQTRTALDVLYGDVPANEFSHYVWNDLVDKVVEVRDALGLGWGTRDSNGDRIPTASGCKMYSGDTLSASAYNGVRYNIGSIETTGITPQSPGDRIYGYMIYDLTTVLNDIINNIQDYM